MKVTGKRKWFSLVFVSFVLLCPSAYSQQRPTISGREILDRVISTYASCRSYSDQGEMEAKRNTWSRTAKFSTAFVRPSGFRYELESEMLRGRAVVWKDAESEEYTGWASQVGQQELPLEEGLSRISFFSAGSSLFIPMLLVPKSFVSVGLLELLADPKLTDTEQINGR